MSYKIVRNSQGDVVAYGPNDDNYEPHIKTGEVLTIENTVPNSLVDMKKRRLGLLAEIVKQKRTAGVTVNGLHIATDADGRSFLLGAKQGGKPSRKIVTKTGRAILTKAEVEALSTAVDDYLHAVFDNQYDLEEAIETASDQYAFDAIDITAGLP